MFAALLIRLVITAAAFAVAAAILDGMELSGGFLGLLWIAIIFGLVNAIVGTLLRILTFPLILLTLGLFAVIVNALLLEITDALTSKLTIDHFWWTSVWAAIIIAVVSVVIEAIIGRSVMRPRRGQTA